MQKILKELLRIKYTILKSSLKTLILSYIRLCKCELLISKDCHETQILNNIAEYLGIYQFFLFLASA
jgi:hypothetical protein